MNKIKTFGYIALMTATMISCGKKEELKEEERIEQVKVLTLQEQDIDRKIELSTTLEGYETVNIAPSITGKIEHIFVEIGSRINKGQDLVRMDQNQYNTTKLAFANLKVEMSRMKALRETGSVSQQNYDQTKLSYDQTEENLEFLKKNTFVKAPISGVISAKNYEDGELYNGQAILVLTQISTLKAVINIPESYFPIVKAGMKINVATDIYPDQTFPATIEIIYPTIDQTTHNFQVKVRIPNGNEKLRPGMFARTSLSLGKANTLLVPFQSVLKLQGSNDRYMFIAENGKAKRIAVTLGQRFNDQIEVNAKELKAGVQVIVVGQARLVDGVKINIVK